MMPDEMIEFDAGTRDFVRAKRGEHRARTFRRPQDAHGDLGDDSQLPLAAGEQAQPVVAGSVEMLASDREDLAVHRDDLQS